MTDRKTVVVWSGGADSTMLLFERAREATPADPVLALTIDAHQQVHAKQLASQRAAQKRFLSWAKKQGFHIKHSRLTVKPIGDDLWLSEATTQAQMWISHMAPYFPQRCRVEFGYIRPDSFWHGRHEADAVLKAMQNLAHDADWSIGYPYEWSTKAQILDALRSWKVPANCWWSCEKPPAVGKPCRKCNKCIELRRGREDLKTMSKETTKKKARR